MTTNLKQKDNCFFDIFKFPKKYLSKTATVVAGLPNLNLEARVEGEFQVMFVLK
jgi:hypothetical protein